MKCTLVKAVSVVKDKQGKDKTYTNFALRFENGDFLPIQLKSYTAKVGDKKNEELMERINHDNWVKINTLADLESYTKDEGK